jgi:hypothetical protein
MSSSNAAATFDFPVSPRPSTRDLRLLESQVILSDFFIPMSLAALEASQVAKLYQYARQGHHEEQAAPTLREILYPFQGIFPARNPPSISAPHTPPPRFEQLTAPEEVLTLAEQLKQYDLSQGFDILLTLCTKKPFNAVSKTKNGYTNTLGYLETILEPSGTSITRDHDVTIR